MRNKIITIAIIILTILSINYAYAEGLTLNVKADKKSAKVEDNITITVDWGQPMQAADYILNYDNTKLEYESSSIDDTYINKTKAGQIGISWFSSDDTDLTNMTFTFKVLEEGATEITTQIDGGFADGMLNEPENYDVSTNGKITLELKKKENKVITYAIIISVILIILAIIIEVIHKKNKKEKK